MIVELRLLILDVFWRVMEASLNQNSTITNQHSSINLSGVNGGRGIDDW
jgi:hypothetical protein